jgi:hypothetical protein
MSRIHRICRWFARLTGLRASQLAGQAPHRPGRPGGDGFAGRFIQDVAAAASVAAGQQPGPRREPRPARGRASRPAAAAPGVRPAGLNHPAAALGLLPHSVQLCIHCRQSPAGFWVSRRGGQTVRRPWCLSCCPGLDRDRCDVIAFDS